MKKLFEKADKLKIKISEYRPLTEGELDVLREDYVIEFTYNSNAIEGSTLTLDETALVLREGITIGGKSVKEHLEAVGHRDACLYVEDIVREKETLSESLIKNIHSLVLLNRKDDRGIYRRLPVKILGTSAVLPQPYEVPILMERLISDYHSDMKNLHIIEKVARFHLLFESIHPFIDGNGRTGRLIMNLELMKEGYLPIDVKFSDRNKYMNAFKAWNEEENADLMINLITTYTIKSLEKRIELLEISQNHDNGTQDLNME